jgi:hypothetical protein
MIISEKQQEANRKNAQHSTGPVTPAGKEAIRFNALTYGLRTRASILPDENAAEYSQLWDEMQADWQPQTRTERLYLETMVTSQWLLKRVAESKQRIYVFTAFGEERFRMLGTWPNNARNWSAPSAPLSRTCSSRNRNARPASRSPRNPRRRRLTSQPRRTFSPPSMSCRTLRRPTRSSAPPSAPTPASNPPP